MAQSGLHLVGLVGASLGRSVSVGARLGRFGSIWSGPVLVGLGWTGLYGAGRRPFGLIWIDLG